MLMHKTSFMTQRSEYLDLHENEMGPSLRKLWAIHVRASCPDRIFTH